MISTWAVFTVPEVETEAVLFIKIVQNFGICLLASSQDGRLEVIPPKRLLIGRSFALLLDRSDGFIVD